MKPIKKAAIVIAVIVALPVCNIILNLTKPTEIRRIHMAQKASNWLSFKTRDAHGKSSVERTYVEAYIVTNPPTDEKKLKELLDGFIKENDLYQLPKPVKGTSYGGFSVEDVEGKYIFFFKQSLETPLIWAVPSGATDEVFIERGIDHIASDGYSYKHPEFNELYGVNCFMNNVKPSLLDLIFMPAFPPKGWNDQHQ